MQREKASYRNIISKFSYREGKLEDFYKKISTTDSYRVYQDGFVGIYCQIGEIDDELGFQKAEENLVKERRYPYEMESGVRSRNKVERELTDKELKVYAEEGMEYLKTTYPQFVFHGSFSQNKTIETRVNSAGMDYSNTDCSVNIYIEFKHVDSKDLFDGQFDFSLRDYDKAVFCKMADDFLGNYEKEVELPEELIIDSQYYSYVGQVVSQLNAEKLALGTSLLHDKVGRQVFSEDFTLYHDVTDEETWFNTFWDGDGHVTEGDKRMFIEKGKILSGYSDKRCAEKYNAPYTGNAYFDYGDVPGAGGFNARIEKSTKTVKELLNGRYAIVLLKSNGGFNDKGEMVVPVQNALLTDGEKILGRLAPFTFKTTMYDMFGKDYIGVGSDKPIFNDKQILFRVNKEE